MSQPLFRCAAGGAISALLLAAASTVYAQTPPAAGTIEQQVRSNAPALALPAQELQLTGRNDLVLLQPRPLFDLHADLGGTYTTNAFFSDANRKADFIASGTVTARAATQIAEAYDVFVDADVFTNRYARNSVLDYDGFAGSIGAATPLFDGVRLAGSYTGTDTLARGFGHHLLTLNDLNLTLLRSFSGSTDLAITPTVGVTRSYANPQAFDSWAVNVGASGTYAMTPQVSLFATPTVFYKYYDHYFPQVIHVTRQDGGAGLSLGGSWTPVTPVLITAQVNGTYNDSTVHIDRYTAFTVTPTVRLSLLF